jgi:hypothetical protein
MVLVYRPASSTALISREETRHAGAQLKVGWVPALTLTTTGPVQPPDAGAVGPSLEQAVAATPSAIRSRRVHEVRRHEGWVDT